MKAARMMGVRSFNVQCQQCQAQYKLTPSPTDEQLLWMSCPRCGHEIDVEAHRPWRSLPTHAVFGAQPTPPPRPERLAQQQAGVVRTQEVSEAPFWLSMPIPGAELFDEGALAQAEDGWTEEALALFGRGNSRVDDAPVPRDRALCCVEAPFRFERMVEEFLRFESLVASSAQSDRDDIPDGLSASALDVLSAPEAPDVSVSPERRTPAKSNAAYPSPRASRSPSSISLSSKTSSVLELEPPVLSSTFEAATSLPLPPPLPAAVTDAFVEDVAPSAPSVSRASLDEESLPPDVFATSEGGSLSERSELDLLGEAPADVEDLVEGEGAGDRDDVEDECVVDASSEVDMSVTVSPAEASVEGRERDGGGDASVSTLDEGDVEVSPEETASVEVVSSAGGRSRVWWPVGVVCGVFLAFVGGIWAQRTFLATEVIPVVSTKGSWRAAMETASTTVHLAALRDTSSVDVRRAVARDLLRDGRVSRAVGLLEWMWRQPQWRDEETSVLYAQALVRAKRWHRGREVALHGLVLNDQNKALQRSFQKAVSNDPSLKLRTLTLGAGADLIDEIRALGGGKSVSFKMKKQRRNVFAFKPRQHIWIEGWRAEVAADVLCRVIKCAFHVPVNRPARIARADFERLYSTHRSKKQTGYRERFKELMFVREPDARGDVKPYLYGTLKDWLPSFINWPLEYTEIWKSWLRQETSMEVLKHQRLHEVIKPLRGIQRNRFYNGMLREREQLDVIGFARQISQLLVFDFLVSNWDRFSTVEAYYGANTHFAKGRLISLDNGAAFHSQSMQGVDSTLPWIERFSREQIAAIRALTPESFDHVLYPTVDSDAGQRLRVFWIQRKRLLRHVDALIERYGRDAVLAF